MQYFKEHFNDNISETGILQKINDEFYIDDIKIKYHLESPHLILY